MKVLLAGHGGAYNRGCEAIVRGTAVILRAHFGDCDLVLASDSAERDREVDWGFPLEIVPGRDKSVYQPGRTPWFERQRYRLLAPSLAWRVPLTPMLPAVRECDVMLSVGGDNYSADYGYPSYFLKLIDCAKALRKPIVIWGASVGPFPENARWQPVWDRLRQVDLITARETATQEYLEAHGIRDNVRMVADPAWVMEPQEVDLAPFWPGDRVVGVCVSPLVARLAKERGNWLDVEMVRFLRDLIDRKRYQVLFIPHVAGGSIEGFQDCEDHAFMAALQVFVDRAEVALAPGDLRAPEYKYIISKCQYLIAARTHATIASYSTGVPTLALSYSLKARGICRDLFGHTDYLLAGEQADAAKLLATFERLEEDREQVAARLESVHEEMADKARRGAQYVEEVLKKRG